MYTLTKLLSFLVVGCLCNLNAWDITTSPYTFSGQVGIGTQYPYNGFDLDIHTDGWQAIRLKQTRPETGVAVTIENGNGFRFLLTSGDDDGVFSLMQRDLSGNYSKLIVSKQRKIGILKSTPLSDFHVGGDTLIDDSLTVSGSTTLSHIPPQGDVMMGDFTE